MRDTPGVAKHEKAADGIGVAGDVRTLWSSIGPTRARRALVGMALVVALVVCITIVGQVRLNEWQGAFFDEIEQRNRAGFFRELAVFGAIVAVLLVLVVSQTWINERMKVLLREAVTSDLLDAWLRPARAYELTFAGDIGEHPDQRIHEDARHLSELTVDLGIGLMQTTLLFASFIGVLWGLSAGMTLPFRRPARHGSRLHGLVRPCLCNDRLLADLASGTPPYPPECGSIRPRGGVSLPTRQDQRERYVPGAASGGAGRASRG